MRFSHYRRVGKDIGLENVSNDEINLKMACQSQVIFSREPLKEHKPPPVKWVIWDTVK